MLAAQAIRLGEAGLVVAGGMESMTRAPYLLTKAREGYRMGNGELIDAMIQDGLWDVYGNKHMGTYGDRCAAKYGFTKAAAGRLRRPQPHRGPARRSRPASSPSEIVPVEITVRGKTTRSRPTRAPAASTRRSSAASSRPSAPRGRSPPATPRASTTAPRRCWSPRGRNARSWA